MILVDALGFVLSGFALVLATLALLWMVSAAIGRVFATTTRHAMRTAAPPPDQRSAMPTIPFTHVAAIAAAVAVVTDGRGRVVTVRAPGHLAAGWSHEGRSDHASSHGNRVRWDWAMPGPPHTDHDLPDPALTRGADHKRTQ